MMPALQVRGVFAAPALNYVEPRRWREKPIALAKVFELSQNLSIPVIAIGGIASAQDAIEFLIAGATAFQVGTANFYDPDATITIKKDLEFYCQENNIVKIADLIGSIQL